MVYSKKTQIKTGELKLINSFLASGFFEKFADKDYDYSIIQEPYTGFGYADIVCLKWNKSINEKWNLNRNNLDQNDIKILHHLHNCRVYKSLDELKIELGFSINQINKTILKLLDSKLVKENVQNKIRIKPLKEIFFIKEIISIEAKLKDWKRAYNQSLNNVNFSSKSFTLFPEKTINKKLLSTYRSSDVGVLSFNKTCRELVKPKRNKIPGSLTSWFFNEYIGRNHSIV